MASPGAVRRPGGRGSVTLGDGRRRERVPSYGGSVASAERLDMTPYERKRAEGKKHNTALIYLARRRCNVILAILRTGQPYRAQATDTDLTEAA